MFYVRDIGRLKLGTKYPAIAEHVAEVVRGLNARGVRPYLLVDSTGVGAPALDIMRPKFAAVDVLVSAVTFTGGEQLRGYLGAPDISMPKAVSSPGFKPCCRRRGCGCPTTSGPARSPRNFGRMRSASRSERRTCRRGRLNRNARRPRDRPRARRAVRSVAMAGHLRAYAVPGVTVNPRSGRAPGAPFHVCFEPLR